MADLSTTYMGLKLRNPVVVSSSGLTSTLESIRKCEEASAGAVVLKSIFEEQFLVDEDELGPEYAIYPEALDTMRSGALMEYAPHKICGMIEAAKKEVGIPVIASVNCQHEKLWPGYARQFEHAGADALELNIYVQPIELDRPGQAYEDSHLKILREVKTAVSIPVAVKLTFQVTALPHLGKKLADAGCDALVLFNWFLESDIDVKTLKTRNIRGKGHLSDSLRWVALLAGRVGCEIAASGGVRAPEDVVKQILAGAAAVQVCSVLYDKGLAEIKNLTTGLESWMDEHRFDRLEDFRGDLSFKKQELSFRDLGEAKALFRAQYMKAYTK